MPLIAVAAVAALTAAVASVAPSSNAIVPGESLGAVRIGESKKDVRSALGKPTKEGDGYDAWASRSSLHVIVVAYDGGGNVAHIEATSPQFRTAAGVDVDNYALAAAADFDMFERPSGFDASETATTTVAKRKDGGLAFFGVWDAEAPYGPGLRFAVVYAGHDVPTVVLGAPYLGGAETENARAPIASVGPAVSKPIVVDDLAVATVAGGGIVVTRGTAPVQSLSGVGRVVVGDVDGDGHADLLLPISGAGCDVYLYDDGRFVLAKTISSARVKNCGAGALAGYRIGLTEVAVPRASVDGDVDIGASTAPVIGKRVIDERGVRVELRMHGNADEGSAVLDVVVGDKVVQRIEGSIYDGIGPTDIDGDGFTDFVGYGGHGALGCYNEEPFYMWNASTQRFDNVLTLPNPELDGKTKTLSSSVCAHAIAFPPHHFRLTPTSVVTTERVDAFHAVLDFLP